MNVPLADGHWHLALLQLAIRDGKSVPEVLRPIIIGHLRRQLAADPTLAAAVASMEESMSRALSKTRRRRNLAEVRTLKTHSQIAVRKSGKTKHRPIQDAGDSD